MATQPKHGFLIITASLLLIITGTTYCLGSVIDNAAARFYLLENGTDIHNCGITPNEACLSFSYLLDVFHTKYEPTLPDLDVVTDVSIRIDRHLQDQHSWLSGLKINFDNFLGSSTNISLTLDSVNLTNSAHKVNGIRMTIENSKLTNYQLKLKGMTEKKLDITEISNSLVLDESTLRSMRLIVRNTSLVGTGVKSVIAIDVSESLIFFNNVNIHGANQSNSVISVWNNSYLVLNNSFLSGNSVTSKNSAVVRIHQSKATITNSEFVNNSGNNGGVIDALVRTKIRIANCAFVNNSGKDGGTVCVFVRTTVNITNCTFVGNSATYFGGAIYAKSLVDINLRGSNFISNKAFYQGGAIFSNNDTTFEISKSIFTQNNATNGHGGSIAIILHNRYFIKDCQFKENLAVRDGGALYVDRHNLLSIRNSEFIDNQAAQSGVLRAQYSGKIMFKSCKFTNNKAVLTQSVISAQNDVTMNIDDCLFDNNTAPYFGVLDVLRNSSVTASNNIFTRNSVIVTSIVHADTNATLAFVNCQFHNNTGGNLFMVEDKSELYVTNCSFSNHSLATNPMMNMIQSILILNNSTFDNNSQSNEGGIVFSQISRINVISCQFVGNHAIKGTVFYLETGSSLTVETSLFMNNSAGDAAVAYLQNSTALFSKIEVISNEGLGYGGVISAYNSEVTVEYSNFSGGKAFYGGCFYLQEGSSLAAYGSVFENCSATRGGAIFKYGTGNVSLGNCILRNNAATFGPAIFHYNGYYIRLAGGCCLQHEGCIAFEAWHKNITWFTHNYTINNGTNIVNSVFDNHFLEDAVRYKMVDYGKSHINWRETPYASLLPISCGDGCHCYYIQDKANVYNCSATSLQSLPNDTEVPSNTNWLDLSNNKMTRLHANNSYLKSILNLDISNNSLNFISKDKLENLGNLKILNLLHNQLKRLPKNIVKLTNLTHVWLSDNPFECDCDMLWIVDWMANFTIVGTHTKIVRDYYDIKCNNGDLIYKLDPVEMGCFPKELTLLQKILIGVSASVTIAIVIAIIAISRRWNEVKWFMYLHFDILDKNDGNENLEDKESDALLSYSEEDENLMRELFMKYDEVTPILEEDHGFQMILHQRDFMPGVTILDNIAEAVTKSRRMIMLLSRNYVNSNYCMEEFKLAHHKMVHGDKKFLIAVLLEPLDVDALPRDLQMYLRTYTYIDATKLPRDNNILRKKVRFTMPGTPLSILKKPRNQEDEVFINVANNCNIVNGGEIQNDERRPLLERENSIPVM